MIPPAACSRKPLLGKFVIAIEQNLSNAHWGPFVVAIPKKKKKSSSEVWQYLRMSWMRLWFDLGFCLTFGTDFPPEIFGWTPTCITFGAFDFGVSTVPWYYAWESAEEDTTYNLMGWNKTIIIPIVLLVTSISSCFLLQWLFHLLGRAVLKSATLNWRIHDLFFFFHEIDCISNDPDKSSWVKTDSKFIAMYQP